MNTNLDQSGVEPLFPRPYTVGELPAKGVNDLVEASENERVRIAAALDLAGLENFRMDFQLSRAGKRHFKLSGHMVASATQICVVSLKPVETRVDEKIEIEFWPPEDVARLEAEVESESVFVPLDGPEPVLDGVIDVGQLAYEHLAASLDLYPKKAGARFEWSNPEAEEPDGSADRPFAGLARLKGRRFSNSE